MKPFEERYTAWIDGLLEGEELAAFEAELASHPELAMEFAEADRVGARSLGSLLRTHAGCESGPAFADGEAFTREVVARIEEGRRAEMDAAWQRHWRRVVWAGCGCFATAAVLFVTLVVPEMRKPIPGADEYFAKILNAQAGEGITAVAYHDSDANVTVLWLDGMDYMPGEKGKR